MARVRTPNHEVGFKKPPRHKRWKKGQSGNPKGRPKRTPKPPPPANLSEEHAQTLRLLGEEVPWDANGLAQRVTSGEAVQRALIRQAMAGDVHAIKLVQEQEALARGALDTIREAETGADTAALTVQLARLMRSQAPREGEGAAPCSHCNPDAARPVEQQSTNHPREEPGLSGSAALAAPGKTVAGPAQGGTERSSNKMEADIDATSAREVPQLFDQGSPVYEDRQPCLPRRPTKPYTRRSNEPLIRDPRPLTW
jgi:hypothetical protein